MCGFSRWPGGAGLERALAVLERAGQPPGLRGQQQVREHRVHDDPILERETDSSRGLRAVAQHPPAAIGRAHQISCIEVQPASPGRRQAMAFPQERRVGVQPFRRQDPFVQQPLRSMEITEYGVEQQRPLDDRRFQRGPLGAVDHTRNQVERPGALLHAGAPVDVKRHAVVADESPGLLRPSIQLVTPERRQRRGKRTPVGADGAAGIDHLVVVARKRRVDRRSTHEVGSGKTVRAR